MKLVVNEIRLYPGLSFYEALQFMVRHFYFILSVLGCHWRILNRKVAGHGVHFDNSSGCCVETGPRERAETGSSVQGSPGER